MILRLVIFEHLHVTSLCLRKFHHVWLNMLRPIDPESQSVANPGNFIYIGISFPLTKREGIFLLLRMCSLTNLQCIQTHSLQRMIQYCHSERARLTYYILSYTRLNTRQSLRTGTSIHFSSTSIFGNETVGELVSGRIKPERQDSNAVVLELAERPAPNQCEYMTYSMEHGTI